MSASLTMSFLPGVLPIKVEGERLLLVDQRKLPAELCYFDATSRDQMVFAIKDMVVRGAPSIGVAAAFGLAFEARRLASAAKHEEQVQLPRAQAFLNEFSLAVEELNQTRPTAVNLVWATRRMAKVVEAALGSGLSFAETASQAYLAAEAILSEHLSANLAISQYGSELVPNGARLITHCNAGGLAACGYGTALGVIRAAHFNGKNISVYVDETRPRNQGAKLTMWELAQDQVPSTLICDSMSGHLMSKGQIDMVITGADRIALNGDSANKIGTYNLAVLAHYHKIPFYIAAPLSTFDSSLADGETIPIEERDQGEVLTIYGAPTTVPGAQAFNPGFDVTPAQLISGIITEVGVLRPDYVESIGRALLQSTKK
ncbi:MAG: Methylthioribose-phosphate isomerase [Cyanobacteriota bacterium erpe_2018_sw_21hr_WHONDRS-SW48-000092_B_bin.40]|nr:Methylthioribose-phosphate isomerase [Cyanobacteriota bacterium erpe_2018_sw_21hr_WHONDRS-SW48-000092_B_bin.40]